jgi:outer membrane murein-binding lipoprotein Lpp
MDNNDSVSKTERLLVKVTRLETEVGHLRNDMEKMAKSIGGIKEDVNDLKEMMDSRYVTRTEFEPIRNIIYGMVGVVLLAVVTALVALVVM